MSSKMQRRREAIKALVLERGAVSVGSLAERFDVSMQTIRRDVDVLCESDMLHRMHGRIELSEEFLNTPFDQRASTNPLGKRAIGEAAAALILDRATVFISIGSTPLSVAQALRHRTGLTVITNNLSAAMALGSGCIDFHTAEVCARQKMRDNAQTSLLVVDVSKFGRPAPALGDNIADMDMVIVDRRPGAPYAAMTDQIRGRVLVAEGDAP